MITNFQKIKKRTLMQNPIYTNFCSCTEVSHIKGNFLKKILTVSNDILQVLSVITILHIVSLEINEAYWVLFHTEVLVTFNLMF